jgi:hypothetical protein
VALGKNKLVHFIVVVKEMYQSNQARDEKENHSLLPAVGEALRPAFLATQQP